MDCVFWCIILYILCQNTVESEWNSNDYLKREFSLVKPYSGIINSLNTAFLVILLASAVSTTPMNVFKALQLVSCICGIKAQETYNMIAILGQVYFTPL